MVPKAVIMKSALVSVNIARQVNIAHTKTTVNGASPMPKAVVNAVKGNNVNVVNASTCWGNLQQYLQEKGLIDSGCLRHMTGNMSYLTDFEEIDGGYVAFGGDPKGGKIISRGTIKTGTLNFENVYFLTDESHVLLKVPRKNNMYSVDLKNIVPKRGLTCLFAKATSDESKLWHRRLGHINFKTMNKLVKGNLVKLEWRQYLAKITFCYHCGLLIHHSLKVQRVLLKKKVTKEARKEGGDSSKDSESNDQEKEDNVNSTNTVNAASTNEVNAVGAKTSIELPDDLNMHELEDIIYSDDDADVGAEADMNNLDAF
ncbi:ribonuclease H-like domain-containing protein [Tanacetum coccineum]